MQIEKLIDALESKYKISIAQFLELYQNGYSREEMAEDMSCGDWCVRAVASALNLRMAKKYRAHDYALYLSRFSESANSIITADLVIALEDLNVSYKDNVKLERQLVQARRDLNKYRSVTKQPEIDIEAILADVKTQEIYPEVTIGTSSEYYKDYTQFVLLSDLHCEEVVSSKDVGNLNEYNWAEFERRLDKVFKELLLAYRGESKCILLSLGDNISGIIHGTLETTSKYTREAIADLAKILAYYTNTLATIYDEVEIMCVTGNHSRLSEQKKAAANGFNLEYLMFKIWEALADKDNVKFNFGTSGYVFTQVGDKYLAGCHGDLLKGGSGVTRTLRTQEIVRQTLGITPNHIFQGHLHTPSIEQTPNGGAYIVNGSLIGPSTYSHSFGFVGLRWSQTIGSFLPDGTLENMRWVTD